MACHWFNLASRCCWGGNPLVRLEFSLSWCSCVGCRKAVQERKLLTLNLTPAPVFGIMGSHEDVQGHQAQVVDASLLCPVSSLLPARSCPCLSPCLGVGVEGGGLPGGVSELGGVWGQSLQALPWRYHLSNACRSKVDVLFKTLPKELY